MAHRIELIEHNGKQIYYLNFSEKTDLTEIMNDIQEVKSFVITQPLGSVLFLTNVSNTSYSTGISDAFMALAEHNRPYAKASAVVGITGLKKFTFEMILRVTGRKIRVFDSLEEAKDWLISVI